ncbi:hypothetical protein HispidOSU_014444, partial [Sigmodon hispidus]
TYLGLVSLIKQRLLIIKPEPRSQHYLYLSQAAHLSDGKDDSCFRLRDLKPDTLDLLRPG